MRLCCAIFNLLTVAALCRSVTLHGQAQDKSFKVFVRFLATSTVVRSGWSGNQDVYLAELQSRSDKTPRLAKLVDEYWGEMG
jgi:hypothetical protein